MLAMAARKMNYRTVILDPEPNCPAGQVADGQIADAYSSSDASLALARQSDVVTYEFENVDADSVEAASGITAVYPSASVLRVTQHRLKEKAALADAKILVTPFRAVKSIRDLQSAGVDIGYPMVLKTATDGYDGKGQVIIRAPEDLAGSYELLGGGGIELLVEQYIPFLMEISVICARTSTGQTATFPPSENIHVNHILDTSIVPARLSGEVIENARSLAVRISEHLDVVGLIAVEMFITETGQILVNELAPRPHNSGHYTIDGCDVSQFEQLVRVLAGMPIADPVLHSPSVMVNLLGEVWEETDGDPDWAPVLAMSGVNLHLYGKAEARIGRKMGHINVVADTVDEALYIANEARNRARRRKN